MNPLPSSFADYLDTPLRFRSRIFLALLVVPLLFSLALPLWRISMTAPQYPKGLWLDIHAGGLDAGNRGHDLTEINTLNHYIGMAHITREELRDLDWLPFGLIGLALVTLRCAALGNVRAIIDVSMMAAYISMVAFGRFIWMLWTFGHNLDPKAPVRMDPFMPVVFGSKQIANFMTHSWPRPGSALLFTFTFGVWALTAWLLWSGRAKARRYALSAA